MSRRTHGVVSTLTVDASRRSFNSVLQSEESPLKRYGYGDDSATSKTSCSQNSPDEKMMEQL